MELVSTKSPTIRVYASGSEEQGRIRLVVTPAGFEYEIAVVRAGVRGASLHAEVNWKAIGSVDPATAMNAAAAISTAATMAKQLQGDLDFTDIVEWNPNDLATVIMNRDYTFDADYAVASVETDWYLWTAEDEFITDVLGSTAHGKGVTS